MESRREAQQVSRFLINTLQKKHLRSRCARAGAAGSSAVGKEFSCLRFDCSRPRFATSPVNRAKRTAPLIEGLEGRVLLAFNAYIAGPPGGTPNTTYSFTFSS